jgi:NAD(P)-dependent dehydrogenase (short-subunit alcohol dehydrogenase family)
MKEFRDKVAVITGAASGIGRALAERCAQEGMKVVLADVDKEALTQAAEELKDERATVLAVQTDVSKTADIEALARKTLDSFGAVHLLCNNAGVGPLTSILGSSEADWIWVMGANLWSVIHGVRIFAPVMIKQGTDGHIVNTASRAGLISGPGLGVYRVTKHAVVALSETLYHELVQRKAKVHISVLCPSFVNTRIMDSERNRPLEFREQGPGKEWRPEDEALERTMRKGMESAISPREVADCVFNAIKERKFYIFPHPELKELVRIRMEDILQERNPTNALR